MTEEILENLNDYLYSESAKIINHHFIKFPDCLTLIITIISSFVVK